MELVDREYYLGVIAELDAALQQIYAVCSDNAGDECGHKLALAFVRQVAGNALNGRAVTDKLFETDGTMRKTKA
jgi:hypothetical protein